MGARGSSGRPVLWHLLLACGCAQDRTTGTAPSPPAGVAWTRLAPMNEARQEVGVAELQGKIYVAGGFATDRRTVATVETYDIASDRWSFVAPMPALNHCVAAAVGGRLSVVGGFEGSGGAS